MSLFTDVTYCINFGFVKLVQLGTDLIRLVCARLAVHWSALARQANERTNERTSAN